MNETEEVPVAEDVEEVVPEEVVAEEAVPEEVVPEEITTNVFVSVAASL